MKPQNSSIHKWFGCHPQDLIKVNFGICYRMIENASTAKNHNSILCNQTAHLGCPAEYCEVSLKRGKTRWQQTDPCWPDLWPRNLECVIGNSLLSFMSHTAALQLVIWLPVLTTINKHRCPTTDDESIIYYSWYKQYQRFIVLSLPAFPILGKYNTHHFNKVYCFTI